MSNLREKVKEFAEIAATVPENLRVVCFETLLRDYLSSRHEGRGSGGKEKTVAEDATPKVDEQGKKTFEEVAKGQADITLADLHVKTRKFLDKHGLSIAQINNLFYKEGNEIKPLYEDLKTTRMSEAQIRVTLLQALHNALGDGEFSVIVENVRTECRDRKALDGPNFAANYKNNTALFDFGKYDKDTKSFRLSEEGRAELGELIKELQ